MDFGQAIEALKEGKKVARAGWNGKGCGWHTHRVASRFRRNDSGPDRTGSTQGGPDTGTVSGCRRHERHPVRSRVADGAPGDTSRLLSLRHPDVCHVRAIQWTLNLTP